MRKLLTLTVVVFFFGASYPVLAAMRTTGEDETDKTIEEHMSPEWRACEAPQDCSLIQYGCTGVMAANKQHVPETSGLAHTLGGNPAEMKCEPVPQPDYVTSCITNQCFATQTQTE